MSEEDQSKGELDLVHKNPQNEKEKIKKTSRAYSAFEVYLKNQIHVGNVLGALGIAIGLPSILGGAIAFFTKSSWITSIKIAVFGESAAFNSVAVFFSSAFFIAAALAGVLFRVWKVSDKNSREKTYMIQDLVRDLEAYQKPEPYFRAWAQANTECDKRLFELLFYERESGGDKNISVSLVRQIIEKNMEDTIDTASLIISAFTGIPSSASFEALKPDEVIRDYTSWYTEAKENWCDRRSRQEKNVQNRKTYLHQNYAYKYVIEDRNLMYVCDDLLSDKEYKTHTQKGWEKDKNATIVHVVNRLIPVSNPNLYPYTGVLIIENKKGSLDQGTCKHYVKEFCHRLAIMQYRLDMVTYYARNHVT